MPYFQLRITLSETRTRHVVYRSIKALIRHYNLNCYSCGYEELNGYGEPCPPHFHFNFVEDIDRVNPKRCIQDWLRRHYASQDIELKGNKQWSLQMVEEPKDYDAWFRYPLKENPLDVKDGTTDPSGNWGPTPEEYAHMVQRARDEKATTIEYNLLRREKLRVKDQFKKKMYDYIDEECKEGESDKRVIWTTIFQYYRKIEKPINFSVIEGYTNLWLADHGHLSADSAFDLAHFNNNN